MGYSNIGATLSLKNGNFFTGIKSASSAADGFKSKLKGATSGLKTHSSQLNVTGSSLKSLAGKVVGVVAAYASMHQIVLFTKDCISAANAQAEAEKRLEHEMMNVVGASQQQVDGIKKYASELQGLTTVGDEVAITGASQLASFKLQSDTIKTLMPALNDLAVGQNGVAVSQDQMKSAADMVGKAMSGNITTLKKLIPSMSASQQSILKNGTEAERAAVVVDLLKEKYGGLAEAMANTPEGRIQQLKNAWGDMQEVIGAKLYPVITKVLTWATDKIPVVQNMLSGVMDKLQPAFSWFGNSALPMVENAFGGVISIGQSIYDAVSPSLGNLKDAFVNIKDALGEAFNGSSVDGVTSLASGALSTVIDALATVGNMIAGVIDHWDTFKPIIEGVVGAITAYKVITGIASAATTVMSAAQAVLNGVLMANPIGLVVIAVAGLVAAFVWAWNKFEGFRNFWKGLWNGIKSVVSVAVNVVKGTIDVLKNAVSGIKDKLGGLWNGIKEGASKGVGALKQTVSDSLSSIKSAYEEHGGGIKGVAAGAIEGVKQYYLAGYNYLNNLTGGKLGEITGKVKEKMSVVGGYFKDGWETIKNRTGETLNNIKSAYEEHGGGIAGITAATMQGMKEYFTAGYDFINNLTGGKLGEVVNLANEKLSAAKDAISSKWEEIKSSTAEKWQAVTSGVKQFAENIRSGLVDKFTSIKNGIVDAWKGVVSGIKGCINRIISAVNAMIGGVNKISFDTPDWVPGIGGKKWGFNISKIPMLANGGVIRQPGSVIVGERGPETLTLPKGASVTPLDKGKRSENINHFDIDININGVDKPLDEAFNEALEQFVARLQLQLANL